MFEIEMSEIVMSEIVMSEIEMSEIEGMTEIDVHRNPIMQYIPLSYL